MSFKVIAFDLDDTLLDTSGLILPQAIQESCQAMIEAGLPCSEAECVQTRALLHRTLPGRDVHELLVQYFVPGKNQGQNIVRAGKKAFYDREVRETLELFPSARELLQTLRAKYKTFLVTSGSQKTQQQKIKKLKLEPLFESLHIVDPFKGETKLSAFRDIQIHTDVDPSLCLSVGNRLDTDIRLAKQLGWKGCWVKQGEHAHLGPQIPLDNPDYEISHIHDLMTVCHL